MEKDLINVPPAQFSIGNIILLESNFVRDIAIKIDNPSDIQHESEVEISHTDLSKDVLVVFMTYNFKVVYKENVILTTLIKYSGEFKVESSVEPSVIASFANINAPAIMYPFVRENIASLTSKAMVGSVLIPPVNFIKLYQDKQKSSNLKPE